jgi:hypothetical protein
VKPNPWWQFRFVFSCISIQDPELDPLQSCYIRANTRVFALDSALWVPRNLTKRFLVSWLQNLVVCPICKKNPLYQNNRIIFCRCGMRVDTKSDSINLRYLQTVLLDSVQEHGFVLRCW